MVANIKWYETTRKMRGRQRNSVTKTSASMRCTRINYYNETSKLYNQRSSYVCVGGGRGEIRGKTSITIRISNLLIAGKDWRNGRRWRRRLVHRLAVRRKRKSRRHKPDIYKQKTDNNIQPPAKNGDMQKLQEEELCEERMSKIVSTGRRQQRKNWTMAPRQQTKMWEWLKQKCTLNQLIHCCSYHIFHKHQKHWKDYAESKTFDIQWNASDFRFHYPNSLKVKNRRSRWNTNK